MGPGLHVKDTRPLLRATDVLSTYEQVASAGTREPASGKSWVNSMIKRQAQIQMILREARRRFKVIASHYLAADWGERVADEIKLDVKNVLENLKSCLDYLAKDIADRYAPSTADPKLIAFPFVATEAEAILLIENRLCPGLVKARPKLHALLVALNYSNPSSLWLKRMNQARNAGTHDDFANVQQEVAVPMIGLSLKGGSEFFWTAIDGDTTFRNCRITSTNLAGEPIDSVVLSALLKDGIFTPPQPRIRIRHFSAIQVKYKFATEEVGVLNVLSEAIEGVDSLTSKVWNYL
jgi:hypothetical protein